ncbi:NfeD family protein [Deinococcus multiflagellatus]|uniref:NfeD family protein n=1 Tax=Deinococcus multiflagellatus TaxID=1656887 RepID=A0ABW1ZEW7_9DEIO|nr:NfeD family protein [Deinococcus multiflagellatus]MBZ9712739.1 NfeD family protein [Deinococcus multiflagellatus]
MDWWPTLSRVAPWHWWVLGALLLMLEVAAPGVFFVWLALAAFALGLLVFVLPLPVAVQLLLFAVLSVAAVVLGRRYMARLLPDSPEAERLNQGSHRLVGQTVVVTRAIENGVGRVRVGDGEWRVTGPDTPEGARVLIVAADGATLHVREVNGTWT